MKNLYCIVVPSGSGKTTIVNALKERYGYRVVESFTTRAPRYIGESGYHFVSDGEFHTLGKLYAYTKFDGHEYGVTAEVLAEGDLYILDPAGAVLLRDEYQVEKEVQIIGLAVSEPILRQRMKQRGDSDDKISRRLANDSVVFRNLSQLSDIYIDAEGPVAPICECIHEFIEVKERQAAWKHEFSLRDTDGKLVSSGKLFYDMEDALDALREAYPDGLPDGWYVVDETEALKESYIKAIKQCNPAFKISGISVDMERASSTSSDGGYLAVPFHYHGKDYIYREHLCQGWIESFEKSKPLDDVIQNAVLASEKLFNDSNVGVSVSKDNDKKAEQSRY